MAMQSAGELASKATANPPLSSSGTRASLPLPWTARLFAKLQARYGRTWQAQWPTAEMQRAAMAEWGERLAGMDGETLRRGLDSWRDDWPPNVEQFRKACLGIADDWEHRGAAYKRFQKALPKPKANPEIVAEQIAAMRRAVKR